MTNLRNGEIVFFLHLTKIGTDENKAIYITCIASCEILRVSSTLIIVQSFVSFWLTFYTNGRMELCFH